MVEPIVTVDTRNFDAALRRYLVASKKSIAEICNKKAALVAIGATRTTQKASRQAIESELGKYVTVQATSKSGKTVNRRTVEFATRKGHSAPLIALIINKRRANKGQLALEGQQLDFAAKKMLGSRFRSIGFLASSWLAAVRKLLPVIQDTSGLRINRSVKQYGKDKGTARPAKPGFNVFAEIVSTITKGTSKVYSIIQAGIQTALNDEAKSMESYVEKKLAKDADEFNRA